MGPERGPRLLGVSPAAAAWPGSWPDAAGPRFWHLWLRGVEGPLLPGEPAGTARIPAPGGQSSLFVSLTVIDRHFLLVTYFPALEATNFIPKHVLGSGTALP